MIYVHAELDSLENKSKFTLESDCQRNSWFMSCWGETRLMEANIALVVTCLLWNIFLGFREPFPLLFFVTTCCVNALKDKMQNSFFFLRPWSSQSPVAAKLYVLFAGCYWTSIRASACSSVASYDYFYSPLTPCVSLHAFSDITRIQRENTELHSVQICSSSITRTRDIRSESVETGWRMVDGSEHTHTHTHAHTHTHTHTHTATKS